MMRCATPGGVAWKGPGAPRSQQPGTCALAVLTTATPDETYLHALAAMQALPEPHYVAYESAFYSTQMHVEIVPRKGYATLYLMLDGSPSSVNVMAAYREEPASIMLTDQYGVRLAALSPIFNPTWQGAFDWLRYGLAGPPPPPADSGEPLQAHETLKTIASVTALAPGAYDIADAGAALCPSGMPGERLTMHARYQPAAHPLTEVTVDDATSRFCSMRFAVANRGLSYSMNGYIELHFGQAGAYWLVTGGAGDIGMDLFDSALRSATMGFRYDDFSFTPSAAPPRLAMRKPAMTQALFRHRDVAAAAPASAPQPALKTIVDTRSKAICQTLRENVATAVQRLQTNDAILDQSAPMMLRMGAALGSSSRFSQDYHESRTVTQYAGKNDIDPSLAMNQMELERLAAQIAHNIAGIEAALADSQRFPDPPVTDADKQAAAIKAQLEDLLSRQKQLLNLINGLATSESMEEMMARGDGTFGTYNEPGASRAGNRIVGVNDTNVSFGDPLDVMDPSTRNENPNSPGGIRGGPTALQTPIPQSAQMPSEMNNNPLRSAYNLTESGESAIRHAEDAVSANIAAVAAQCK